MSYGFLMFIYNKQMISCYTYTNPGLSTHSAQNIIHPPPHLFLTSKLVVTKNTWYFFFQ